MSTRAKKKVEAAPTISERTRDVLNSASDKLTRQEILERLGTVTKDQLRKSLNNQVSMGYLGIEHDHLGVPRYYLTGKLPDQNTLAYRSRGKNNGIVKAKAEERIAKKEEKDNAPSDLNKLKEELGTEKIPFNYQEAYTRGYNDAMFHSHRDAYNAGRQSVLKGLLKLLNIKGEVLL